VALLEAGGPDTVPEIHIPAAFPILFKSSLDWDLLGDPEPGLNGRRLYLPRGRMIGGCSSINAMIYLRGNRADYDEWAADGCEGWSYDDVLPYFKRGGTTSAGQTRTTASAAHNGSASRSMPAGRRDARGCRSSRPSHNPTSTADQDRVGRFPAHAAERHALQHRRRVPAPCCIASNLDVVSGAFAPYRLRHDRAVGVQVMRDGLSRRSARREVSLSAGAYQSPVLLMLSGIGPAVELAPFGIEVREDLPVGRNLQDHCMANLNYESRAPALFGVFTPENFALLEQGTGPLTSNLPEAGAFFRTRLDLPAPDLELHFSPSLF
jgi:choline dehydrogenase-like flavoprotein